MSGRATTAIAALSLFLIGTTPARSASPQQMTWEDLSQLTGKTVSLALPGGAAITGAISAVQPDALLLNVRKTSDAKAAPKGPCQVPRTSVRVLELHKKGAKFRIIGTSLGTVAGLAGGLGAAIGIDGLFGSNGRAGQAAAAFVGITAGGVVGGYLLGNSADRHSVMIQIVP